MTNHHLKQTIQAVLTHQFSYNDIIVLCYDSPELERFYKTLVHQPDKITLINLLLWFCEQTGLLTTLHQHLMDEMNGKTTSSTIQPTESTSSSMTGPTHNTINAEKVVIATNIDSLQM